jgi:hypothetical protein
VKTLGAIACCLVFVASLSSFAWAPPGDTVTPDRTAPSYDMKAQSLLDLERVQKRFVDLANAVPADKFTWRPSADSRSFAEVFRGNVMES